MKKKITIDGMTCAHCSSRVKAFLEKLDGVANAEVDLEAKCAFADLTSDVDDKLLFDAVYDAGFDVVSIKEA